MLFPFSSCVFFFFFSSRRRHTRCSRDWSSDVCSSDLGGIVSMFLGAVFLIRSPLTAGGVSLGVALSATLPFGVLAVVLMKLVLRSRKWKTATGKEELIGCQGTVTAELKAGEEGMVRVHGELWRAESSQPVPEGKTVRISKVEGLKLYVEPVEVATSAAK